MELDNDMLTTLSMLDIWGNSKPNRERATAAAVLESRGVATSSVCRGRSESQHATP